jgi:hypothetical protein
VSSLNLKLALNIELINPKFVSLHQELTPIPTTNVRTNIIYQIYIERYKKYLYYYWWALNVPRHSWVKGIPGITKRKRFLQAVVQHRLNYIPTIYIKTQDITFQWKDFEEFYALISHNGPWLECVQQIILTLADFLYSWFEFKKVRNVLLVGPTYKC